MTTPLAAIKEEPGEASELDVVREALKDEYEIFRELGRGGMAIVFHGRDRQLDRDVAVKVLPFSLAFDKEFVERFQREARTAAKLEHPNIIPIYRVGKAGRVIYFVMKFLSGKSLADLIEQRGQLPPPMIRRILTETAGALGYAHKHGIVHRDIKPDNILFDDTDRPMVTDFGIAKAATGTRLTGTGMAIGTPHFMSPEQARAQKLDGRSDIYSLGVVAYQCMAGRVPFDGEDAFSIGYKHIMEEPAPPDLKSHEEHELYGVIARMMAKSPDDRFQNAEELIAALGGEVVRSSAFGSMSSRPTTPIPRASISRDATGQAERPQTTPTTPMPSAGPTPAVKAAPRKKRRTGLLVGSFLFLLAGGGGGGWYYYNNFILNQDGRASAMPVPAPAQPDSGLTPGRDTAAPDTAADTAATPPAAELPNTGVLVFNGAPTGHRIKIDEDFFKSDTLEIDAGTRKIVVTAKGYKPYSVTLPVKRGDTIRLDVAMAKETQPRKRIDRAARARALAALCRRGPRQPNFNPNNCYDEAPGATEATVVTLTPDIQNPPKALVLWVQVNTEGKAEKVLPVGEITHPDFFNLAVRFAQDIAYNPAIKGDKPVKAWTQITFYPGTRQ